MKKLGMSLLLVLFLLVGCTSQSNDDIKKIGVLLWDDHPALNDAITGLEEGLKETYDLDDGVKIIVKNASADASNANLMAEQLLDDGIDLFYGIATPAAQVAMAVSDGEIPVVFNAVTDAVSAGLVNTNDVPGGFVTGASDAAPLDQQLALIKEFLPEAESVGVLYNTGEANSLHQIDMIEEVIGKHNLELVTQGVSGSEDIAPALESILPKVDTLYIISDNTIASATSQVVGMANEVKIPVFMAEAGQFEHGILASDSISYVNLGRAAAGQVHEILFEDKSPSEIPVVVGGETELLVSESVAAFLEIEIPASILERATIK